MDAPVPVMVQRFAEHLGVRFDERLEAVTLFGSYARGEANEDSDLDVLVVLRNLSRSEKVEAIEMAAELSVGQPITLHALVMSDVEHQRLRSLEARLVQDIDEEGIPVLGPGKQDRT